MATTLSGYPETSIADDQLPYFPNVKVEFSSQNSDDERKKYISSSEKACNIMKRPENKTLVKFLNKLDVKKRFDFLKNTYCECFDEMKGDRSGTERMISQVIGEQVVVKLNLIDVKKALDSNPPKEKSPGYDHLQKDMEKIFRSPSSQDDSCRSSGHDTDVSSGSEGGNGNMESSQLMNTQEILETLQDNDNADQSTVADVVLSTNANDRVAPTNADRTTGKMIVSPDGRPPSTTETTETVDANEPTIPLAKSPDASMATPPCIIRAYSIPVDNLSEENFPPKETDHGEFCKLVDAYSIRPRQTRTKRKDDRPVGNGKKETRKNWPPSEARKRKRLRYKQKQIYYRKMATKNNSGVECVVSDKEDDNEKPESTTVASHVVGGTTATESVVPNERPEDEPSEEKLFITDDQMPPLLRLNLPVDPRIIDLSLTSDEEDDMDRPLIVNTGSIFDALTNQADKTVAPDVNRSSNDKSDDSEAMEIDLSPSSDNSETRLSPPGTAFKTPAVQANSVATAAVVRPKLSCRPSSSTDHVQPSVHFPNTVFAEPVPTTSGNVRRLSTALPPPPPIVLLRNTVEERTATPFSVYNRPSVMQPPPPPPPSVPLPPPLLPSSSSMMLVKDKIEDKTTAVREKIKKIVYESYRVYGRNMYIDMLVSRLKAGDLLHNMDARWNTDKAEEVRELLVRLICSLSGSHCNIVPLMGCLMTTFRRTVDTTELTDVGTYREFLVFSEVVKMCVKSRDKQFFKTWLLPDSFKYGCFIVDDVLYGGLSRVKSLHHLVNWTKISLIRKYFRMPSYRVVGLQAANDRANNELRKKLSTAINEGPPSKVAKVGQPLISTNQEVGQSIMANNQGEHHFLAANQVSQSPTLLRPAISVRPQFNVNNFPTFQQNHQLPPPPSYSESSSNSALKQRLTAPPMTPTITYAHKRPQSTLGLVNTSQAPVHYNFGSGVKNTNPYLAKYSTSYPPSYTGYLPNQQQQVRDIMHHAPSQMSTAIQQMSSMAQQMTPMNQQQMSPMTQPMLPMNQPQHTMTQQQISPTMPPLRPKPINVAQQSAPPNQWIMAGPEERLPSYGQYPKQKPIEQTWVAHDPATGQSYPITTQVSPSLPDCESPNMPDRLDQPSTSGIGAKKGLACAPKNPNQSAQDMFDYSLNNLKTYFLGDLQKIIQTYQYYQALR